MESHPLPTELLDRIVAEVSPYHCLKDPAVELPAIFNALRATPARRFLEIGTYQGATAAAVRMAFPGCEVTTVELPDPLRSRFNPQSRDQVGAAFVALGLRGIRQVWMDSAELGSWHGRPEYQFDLVFVDGDHSEPSVRRDLELSRPLLTPEGVIVVHDYTDESDADRPHWTVDVHAAVKAFTQQHRFSVVRLAGWLAMLLQPGRVWP